MKKLLKTISIFAIAAALIVVGVFAAENINFTSDASIIQFTATRSTLFLIEGEVTYGAGRTQTGTKITYSERTYDVDTKRPNDSIVPWSLGKISLNTSNYVFAFTLTFTNEGNIPMYVVITRPEEIVGTRLICTGDNITSTAATGTTDATDASLSLGLNNSVTFSYMLVLMDYSVSIVLEDFNFIAAMTVSLT